MMKARKFLQTTLLGGLAAILPLGLIIIVFRWIINLIEKYLKPLVTLVEHDTKISIILTYVLAVVFIVSLFFLIGLFIRTNFGNMVRNHLENTYLMRIPGYKTARDIVRQFMGNKNSFFSEVVLVDIYGTGVLLTGFVTDETGDLITVFVPTAPNPTSGFVFHVPRDKVFKSKTPVDVAVKSIISCGAGSATVIQNNTYESYTSTRNNVN